MSAFLIAISWNDPEEVAAYKRVGLDDVPSCSTGIFIHADTVDHALSWGSTVLKKFTEFLFPQKDYALEALELHCWVEVNPEDSSWKHCLDFFPHILVGQYPDFQNMTAEAYSEWCRNKGIT
jgi:hypothetical protein